MQLVITADLAQEILNYFMGQPYGAVNKMVHQIQTLQPVPVLEEVPAPPEDPEAAAPQHPDPTGPRNRKERRAEEARKS